MTDVCAGNGGRITDHGAPAFPGTWYLHMHLTPALAPSQEDAPYAQAQQTVRRRFDSRSQVRRCRGDVVIRDGLTRRDVLARDGDGRTDGTAAPARPVPPARSTVEPAPGADPALADEPTDDPVHLSPRRGWLSRLDRRTRSILTAAAIAAAVVNASAVWAYWHITGSATGRATAGTVVELNLRGRSDLNRPLTPGSTGNLTVTVTNDHAFPIRITSVRAAPGTVMADDEHRENGCVDSGVTVARQAFDVQWDVARNDVAAFTVPNGLVMNAPSHPACAGAVFTVPVLVGGTAGVS